MIILRLVSLLLLELMMMVTIEVDLSHLDNLGPSMPEIRKLGLSYMAQDMTRTVDKLSPIDQGTLHKWFIAELTDTQAKIKSPAKYVGDVNYGHSQRPGRFIPGVWQGDKFRYKKGAKTGMVLKASHVKGQHFIEKAINQVVPRKDEHFKKAISEVLG